MRARRGFSLVEMLVAMTITMAVFAITLPFVRAQTRSLGSTAGRLDADQVARFAMRAVEQDLRRAAGEYGQPTLVAVGPTLLVFNANLRMSDTLDVGARDDEVVGTALGAAWPLARAAALPTLATVYPTQDYVNVDGDTTRTETVAYYLVADTAAEVNDTYALYRQYNDQAATEVVSGLYLPGTPVFFSYFRVDGSLLTQLPTDTVLVWTDTLMSRVRTIGLEATGVYYNKFDATTTTRTIATRVTLPVAPETATTGCRGAPSAVGGTPSVTATSSGPRGVTLAWTAAATDTSGAWADDWHYLLERRPSAGTWSRLALVAASGAASYSYVDYLGTLSGTFEYGVTVVGCGAQQSARVSLGSVTP